MAETPADYTEIDLDAVDDDGREAEGGRPLPARRWVVIGAVALGIVTTLLDTLAVHAFGIPGLLTASGLAAIAGATLYGISGNQAGAISRSPAAVAEALTALPDPCYVTDRRGSVLFANAAWRELTGGFDGDRVVPLERLLAGRGGGAEISFRLAQAARTGFAAEEDIEIGPRNAERDYRAIVRPLSGPSGGAVWLFRDLTTERERAEAAERRHRRSLAFIEHAPFGFFAAEAEGRLVFMNARLGEWLDAEPRRLTERRTKLDELVIGEVPALADGEAEQSGQISPLDVDLRGAEGKALPVRILRTRVAVTPAAQV